MASITKKFHSDGYAVRIDCVTNSQNATNNSSNVTISVHLASLKSSYNINSSTSKNGSVTIDGIKYTFTFTAGLTPLQDKTVFTKTLDISHNAEGNKTLSLSATLTLGVTLSGTYYGSMTASGSISLTAIPRSTPLTINGTGTFGADKWINHVRPSTDFTVTLRYVCGSSSGVIVSKAATNGTTWAIPASLQSEIPKSESIGITVYCDTYRGNTLIGTTSQTFECYISGDATPTINGATFTNAELGGSSFWQGVSKLRASVSCSGAYGSTITKYVLTVDDQVITNYTSVITTGVLNSSGAQNVTLTITDSRGNTASRTWYSAITVAEYYKPIIVNFTCKRTGYEDDGAEVISNLGTIGYITATGVFHNNSTSRSRKLMYKPTSSEVWTTINLDDTDQNDYKFSTTLATGSAYNLKYVMTDNITSVEMNIVMQNVYPLINLSADGTAIAFGKECNATNKFMVMMDASFNKNTTFWDFTASNVATFNGQVKIKDKLAFSSNDDTLYINEGNAFPSITLRGNTIMRDRGNSSSLLDIITSGDGSSGNTMLGCYDSTLGGYSHYFRGSGAVVIETAKGLIVNGETITGGSNFPVSLFNGDMTSGTVTLTNGANYKALVIGAVLPNGNALGITPLYVPNYLFNSTTGIDVMIGSTSSYTAVNLKLAAAGSKNVVMTYLKGGRIKHVAGCM